MAIFLCDKVVKTLELDEFETFSLYTYFLNDGNQDNIIVIFDNNEWYGICTYSLVLNAKGIREKCICKEKFVICDTMWNNVKETLEKNEAYKYVPVFTEDMKNVYFAYHIKEAEIILNEVKSIADNKDWLFLEALSDELELLALVDVNEITYNLYLLAQKRNINVVTIGEKWNKFNVKNNIEEIEKYADFSILWLESSKTKGLKKYDYLNESFDQNMYKAIHQIFLINLFIEAVIMAEDKSNTNPLAVRDRVINTISKNIKDFNSFRYSIDTMIALKDIRTYLSEKECSCMIEVIKKVFNKKVACFYGTCHIMVLNDIFIQVKEFTDNYILLYINPLHMMEEEELPSEAYHCIDLLLYQHVKPDNKFNSLFATDRIETFIKSTCIKCCIPYSYFNGYFPQVDKEDNKREKCILKEIKGGVQLFPKSDKFINNAFQDEKNIEKVIKWLKKNDIIDKNELENHVKNSFMELEKREREWCDIYISDFIKENWRKMRLFTDSNHPTDIVFKELALRIFEFIGINKKQELKSKISLSINDLLIYPAVTQNMELEFEVEGYYANRNIYNKKLNFDEYIELYIRNCLSINGTI